ncbi:sigma-54-dependent Fis family transcriptional regulator [candidate division KSB1 bacterium]|nr:sigma-54-dependent Fis family transcriptional regulator [candidate division KSB1 bacterium]
MAQIQWNDILFQGELVGNSPEINQIRKSLPHIGRSDQHVIILGNPGTEKLLVAKIIFEQSSYRDGLLIITDATRLNAAYEYEIGRHLPEKTEPAESISTLSGTIVLQNLEHLTAEAQIKLLNIAKRGYLTLPIQGTETTIETDFRILSTASPAIQDSIKSGRFESELFLSLSALMVKLPALVERKQDIPLLFEYYLERFCAELERPLPAVNFEIFNQMLKHPWQGNLKELENTVRSLVLSSPADELLPEALPFYNAHQQFSKLELQSLGTAIAQVEKELIEKALRRFAGNQSRAAQILGISEPNMRFKMKKLGIRKDDFLATAE